MTLFTSFNPAIETQESAAIFMHFYSFLPVGPKEMKTEAVVMLNDATQGELDSLVCENLVLLEDG